jgi:Contractile injection system tube protein
VVDFQPATIRTLLAKRVRGSKELRITLGTPVPVQFNPTSLKVDRSINVDRAGVTTESQAHQFPSVEAATLTLDLEFDTAEEGPEPVNVRNRTAVVRQFAAPPEGGNGEAPLGIIFTWGDFSFTGVVIHLVEELDYFSANGVPLRAKVGLTIREHDPRLEKKGPAARNARGSTAPGQTGSGTPGTQNTQNTQGRSLGADARIEVSQAGESAQQLAARVGGDPAAWRALMGGLDSPLAIPAGTAVPVTGDLDLPVTSGQVQGFAAGLRQSASAPLASALGMTPDAAAVGATSGPGVEPAPGPGTAAGFLSGVATASAGSIEELARGGLAAGLALSAAGGAAPALAAIQSAQAEAEVASARASFSTPDRVPPAPERAPVAAPGQRRAVAGPSAADRESLVPERPRAPAPDPRALTYGRSVPLRAMAAPSTLADIEAAGRRSLSARARPAEVPVTGETSALPWVTLPAAAPSRTDADREQRRRDARPSTLRWRPGGGIP